MLFFRENISYCPDAVTFKAKPCMSWPSRSSLHSRMRTPFARIVWMSLISGIAFSSHLGAQTSATGAVSGLHLLENPGYRRLGNQWHISRQYATSWKPKLPLPAPWACQHRPTAALRAKHHLGPPGLHSGGGRLLVSGWSLASVTSFSQARR